MDPELKVEYEVRGLYESGWIRAKIAITDENDAIRYKNDLQKSDPGYKYSVFKIVTSVVE